MKAIFIDEILKDCVTKVSAKLLAQLQAEDPNITGVYFQHGHPVEIIKELAELAQAPSKKSIRYPAVWLFRDFPEDKGDKGYTTATVNIIIATRTEPTYGSDKRKEVSFKPILYPILEEFINQIELSGKFMFEGKDMMGYTQIDHYFWGKEGLFGKEGNIFNDWIDCIELKNFKLKPYFKNC